MKTIADILYLELINACNFRCDFCPTIVSKREKSSMPFSLYRKLIDQIAEQGLGRGIALHVLGEPFLYPRLTEAVTYAKERNLQVVLTTNGSLLNKTFAKRHWGEHEPTFVITEGEARQTLADSRDFVDTLTQHIRERD